MHSILQRIQELAQKLGEFEAGLPDRLDAAAARAIATGKVERFLGLTPEVSALAHQYVTWKWRTREVRGAGEQWLRAPIYAGMYLPHYTIDKDVAAGDPVTGPYPCPRCGEPGVLSLRGCAATARTAFRCPSCSHHEPTRLIDSNCACPDCSARWAAVLAELSDAIPPALSAAEDAIRRTLWSAGLETEPTAATMQLDGETHRSNLDRDARAFLEICREDATIDENLGRAVAMLNLRRYGVDRPESTILSSLLERKVVYPVWDCDVPALARTLLNRSLCGGTEPQRKLGDSEKELHSDFDAAEELRRAALQPGRVVPTPSKLRVQPAETGGQPIVLRNIFGGTALPELRGELRYVLNRYYLRTAAPSAPQPRIDGGVPSLFNSEAEASMHAVLRSKYPDADIQTNRPIRNCLKLRMLRGAPWFTDTVRKYLWRAIIDFAVYRNGRLLFVMELQKGPHHNEREWIKKDVAKRRVFEYFGVPFYESF